MNLQNLNDPIYISLPIDSYNYKKLAAILNKLGITWLSGAPFENYQIPSNAKTLIINPVYDVLGVYFSLNHINGSKNITEVLKILENVDVDKKEFDVREFCDQLSYLDDEHNYIGFVKLVIANGYRFDDSSDLRLVHDTHGSISLDKVIEGELYDPVFYLLLDIYRLLKVDTKKGKHVASHQNNFQIDDIIKFIEL